MRKIIALFALMAICVMAGAKGLAPPGQDPVKPLVTLAIEDDAQLGTYAVQTISAGYCYDVSQATRDVILMVDPGYENMYSDAPAGAKYNPVNVDRITAELKYLSIPLPAPRDCLTYEIRFWPLKLTGEQLKIPNGINDFRRNGLPPPYS